MKKFVNEIQRPLQLQLDEDSEAFIQPIGIQFIGNQFFPALPTLPFLPPNQLPPFFAMPQAFPVPVQSVSPHVVEHVDDEEEDDDDFSDPPLQDHSRRERDFVYTGEDK